VDGSSLAPAAVAGGPGGHQELGLLVHLEGEGCLGLLRRVMELSMQPNVDWARLAPELVRSHEALQICDAVAAHLREEDSLVEVSLPTRVYGDIHGQLPDLLQFFNAFSWPDKRRGDIFSMSYVFLGDFVDRGSYSVLVIMLLFSIKVLYPKRVFLVRGNHEDRLMNQNYGFFQDCHDVFGPADGKSVWERANDVFEFLPLAALVENQILCIHGGIGDSISSVSELRNIPKPIVIPSEISEATAHSDRIVLDALWSDPTDNDTCLGVQHSPRGTNTCRFGPDRVDAFNRANGLRLIVRAHECVQAGYEYFAGGQLLTVFSATNYCNAYQNDGAMLVLVRDEQSGEVVEHAQVIKSGSVDTSQGWQRVQYRDPSPMRTADG
jgi:diadenosine tetraphosphatase ApaH/serine/threonine PP2A family protein phosphatase